MGATEKTKSVGEIAAEKICEFTLPQFGVGRFRRRLDNDNQEALHVRVELASIIDRVVSERDKEKAQFGDELRKAYREGKLDDFIKKAEADYDPGKALDSLGNETRDATGDRYHGYWIHTDRKGYDQADAAGKPVMRLNDPMRNNALIYLYWIASPSQAPTATPRKQESGGGSATEEKL